jgi:hypothetical protein
MEETPEKIERLEPKPIKSNLKTDPDAERKKRHVSESLMTLKFLNRMKNSDLLG